MDLGMSLSDFAYCDIRDRIMAGMYDHEYIFTTNRFAEELGTTPTPVKEALNRLVQEGFLTSIPRRGYRLKPVFLKDVYDLLDTRTIIETGAAHDVAKNAPRHPEILKKMQKSIEISLQMRADPSMADTSEPLRKLEHEFHMLYVELTENQMLISLYQNIWNKNVLFYLYNLIQYPISLRRNGFDSHREIYEAILRGDSDKLAETAFHHLDGTRQILDGIASTKDQYGILI